MRRLLPILIVFLTALIGCRGDVVNAEVKTSEGIEVSYNGGGKTLSPLPRKGESLATLDFPLQSEGLPTLIGEVGVGLLHILPTHGSTTGKNAARSLAVRRPQVKHIFFLHDGRRRLETAPFQSAASRDYYVFALRRILC